MSPSTSSGRRLLDDTIASIGPLNSEAMTAARARQDQLTKPLGALGRLEELSIHLAGITGKLTPSLEGRTVLVMAADHGVAAQGVSAYPQEVTAQMVANFLRGGAAINVLARQMGAKVLVVDIGVAADVGDQAGLISRKVRNGTRDFSQEPALTQEEVRQAMEVGIQIIAREPPDLLALGEMGIANTTAASAVVSSITGEPPGRVTGHGTGIDDAAWRHKVAVVEEALALHRPDPKDASSVLSAVGGLEIAGLAGAAIAGAAMRVPVVLDGFISTAAALAAAVLCPRAKEYFIAGHRSVEPGHRIALEWLGLHPLLDLDLRLGEGTGAVLAFPILEAATRLLGEMATFSEAGVSERDASP